MSIDRDRMLRVMLAAAREAAGKSWRGVEACVEAAVGEEAGFLADLAEAVLAGEVGEEDLEAQLRSELRALRTELAVCDSRDRAVASEAAGAALTAFREAIRADGRAARKAGAGKPADRKATRRGAAKAGETLAAKDRRLNVRPDTVDFRDLMYTPSLVEVRPSIPLAEYRKAGVPILDQGREGACTGFGLATVVHYLLRTRSASPDAETVSPRMLYVMARRYDEWPGETYEGSSCRGAMKGWHKHGVCSEALWPHDPLRAEPSLDDGRAEDAQSRPLGAYFRVNHKDLVAMHAAISEVGALYASANVHAGWDEVRADGRIPFDEEAAGLGGHAFAIVAYDDKGFWIQNSWGPAWGKAGFGHVSYEDWLANGSDVWVARLGAPIARRARAAVVGEGFTSSSRARAYAADETRPHIVSLGNDGRLRPGGAIGTSAADVHRILEQDFPRVTAGWKKKRLVLYAHGGLVSEEAAVQRIAEYRSAMLEHECYPLAFVWRTDYWTTLRNMLEDAVRHRRTEGVLDEAKDFMLDRLDDALEPLARALSGKAAWDEMKENALAATQSEAGGARLVADGIARLAARDGVEIHLVGHSAGSIFHGPLVQRLTAPPSAGGLGLKVESCTLWAPACTMGLFDGFYRPAIERGSIGRFALYTLTEQAEQDDDCARIYNKSLLFLVSNAFEARARIPLFRPDGVPLLGMARFVNGHAPLKALIGSGRVTWTQAPNPVPAGLPGASGSATHGGFDDDRATVASTLAFILGDDAAAASAARALLASYAPKAGASRIRAMRSGLERAV